MNGPVRVLLVEDNRADAEVVADALAFASAPRFELAVAPGLGEAAERLAERPSDAILLDLGLPDGDGLDAIARLRAVAPGIAIVVLTGLGDEAVALRALEAGAQDYLVKGAASAEALQRSIRYALARRDADESQRRLAAIVDSSDDAIIAKDRDGTIVSWNPAAERLYGYTVEEAIGQPVGLLCVPDELDAEQQILERVLRGERIDHYETRRLRRDGTEVEISLTVSPITDASGIVIGASSIARDITGRKRLERELKHRAEHDHLTGLLNRARFEQDLAREVALAARHGHGGALLVIDLDRFKLVNDGYGHPVGDDLLRRVGQALRRRVRATDLVARLGGDEFAVLLTGAQPEHVREVAGDLLAATRRAGTFAVGERTLRVTASIGVALLDDRRLRPVDVLVAADRAMYAAKRAGRDRVEFHPHPAPLRLAMG